MLFVVASAACILLDLGQMTLNPGGRSFPTIRTLLSNLHYVVPLLLVTVAVIHVILERFLSVRE